MPVIVPPEAFDQWLNCAEVDAVAASALIVPAPDDVLEAVPVSDAVNRAANDGPELVKRAVLDPAPEPSVRPPRARAKKDDGQASLF